MCGMCIRALKCCCIHLATPERGIRGQDGGKVKKTFPKGRSSDDFRLGLRGIVEFPHGIPYLMVDKSWSHGCNCYVLKVFFYYLNIMGIRKS